LKKNPKYHQISFGLGTIPSEDLRSEGRELKFFVALEK